ncbi:hypothetical protein [Yoonia sp.]|uniref:hypothetical protein n=1 Tax=Yoonia sp. TaxID=2212373 RepID=UPI003A4D2D4C
MISTILFTLAANLSAAPVHAAPPRQSLADVVTVDMHVVQSRTLEDVIFQLQTAGYEIEDITRTFLGRLRVVARNDTTRREIIMSRSTGEIFSDTVSGISTAPAADAGNLGNANPGAANNQGRSPSDNANPRSNERGSGSSGASNSNRSGGSGASSNRGGGGNNSSNARRGSD